MQRFNFPKTPEDEMVARRIGLIVVTIYSVATLALCAGLVSHIASRTLASKMAVSAQGEVEGTFVESHSDSECGVYYRNGGARQANYFRTCDRFRHGKRQHS